MMKKRNRKRAKKAEIVKDRDCEDWCFVCKDGGELILCDYEDCLKVYHKDCVERGDSAEPWTCARHSCFSCHKPPHYHCYCCPNAVCRQCFTAAEFAPIRGKKGLCNDCLDLVMIVEEKVDLETEEGTIDLEDRNTHECLFLEYWEIIKNEEGLTLDDVYVADDRLLKGRFSNNSFKSKKSRKKKEEDVEVIPSDTDSESDYSEDSEKISKRKRPNADPESDDTEDSGKMRRRKRSNADLESDDDEDGKRMSKRKGSISYEFIGWGSKPLIEFLRFLGEDTEKELSQHDVESIITQYIQEKKLFDPRNRRKISCDEKLKSLFRKKFIQRNKIYKLLEAHLIVNLEESEEDEDQKSFYDKIGKTVATPKKQKAVITSEKSPEIEADFKVEETGFASIVLENIKLVYLRRSLVEQLLNEPENFETKVVGSFVKVKNDCRDQKNSYQLLQVTGVKKNSTSSNKSEILLRVANMPTDIRMSTLMDADLCEEEIDDLRQKVENASLPKLTVVELEKKAKELHVDITKHWIQKELVRLQKLISFANEKGWRRELHEYLEQRERLEKPSERERLLQETPKVIPEVVKCKIDSSGIFDVESE